MQKCGLGGRTILCQTRWLGAFARQQLATLCACKNVGEGFPPHSSGAGGRTGSSLLHHAVSVAFQAVGAFPTQAACARAECFWQSQPVRLTCCGEPAAILATGSELFPFRPTEITAESCYSSHSRARYVLLKQFLPHRQ